MDEKRKLEFEKSLELRNFEISNLWKRSWFFGALLIATVSGYLHILYQTEKNIPLLVCFSFLIVLIAVSGNNIQIAVVGHGTATITVTDGAGQRVAITVTATSEAVGDTALRFEWDGARVLLDQANGWSVVRNFPTAGNIGIVHLGERRSLRIVGNNNFNAGVKSGVSLHIIENGGDEQAISLDRFEIVENREGVFTAVGNVGDRRVVIRYRVD